MKQALLNDFYMLTLRDPLFAAEGLDLDNAKLALDELEEVTKNLQILDQTASGRIYFALHPLTRILHPFRFLRSFLESEKARRRFLVSPTFDHAKILVHCYLDTVRSLEKDLSAYRTACLEAQKKTQAKVPQATAYNFYGRRVSFTDFIDCIDVMFRNAQALRSEVEGRSKLLLTLMQGALFGKQKRGSKRPIPKASIIDPIPQKSVKKRLPSQYHELLRWAEQGRDYMYYLKKRYGTITTELLGPIFYELVQFDKKPTVHQFFVSIAKDACDAPRSLYAILADQYHFIELSPDKYKFYADKFTFEPLIKRGIKYWYQPATSFYFTSDLTYYPDLATIIDLKRRPFLNQKLVLSQKSSMLDLLLWNGYFHNLNYLQNITARIKAGKQIGAWHYLLIGRGYPSLYYLPFNRSVWRLTQKPNFLGVPTKQPAFYITFDQLQSNLKKKNLQKIFEGGRIRAEDVDKTLADFEK